MVFDGEAEVGAFDVVLGGGVDEAEEDTVVFISKGFSRRSRRAG